MRTETTTMELVEGIATIEDVDEFVERSREIGVEYGVTVQSFDARYVVDRAHLARAVELAERAFARNEAIARDRSVEILLYAAGRRQINRALTMGVSEGTGPVVTVLHDHAGEGDVNGAREAVAGPFEPAETLGAYDDALVTDFFDISDRELAATDGTVADLVRERVALLTVEK